MEEIRTHIVTTLREFSDYKNKWDELLELSPNANPFLSYGWISSWWEIFGLDGFELKIILVSQGDRLIGGIPWYIRKVKLGFLSLREVRFVGTGEAEKDEVMSEYLDLIYDEQYQEELIGQVSSFVKKDILNLDLYSFNRTLENCFLSKVFNRLTVNGLFDRTQYGNGFRYFVDLDGNYENFLEGMPKSRKKRMLQLTRKMYRDHEVEFEFADSHSAAVKMFDALSELHIKRWQDKGEPGAFSSSKFVNFHRKVLKIFHDKKWLNMHVLRIDNKVASALYNFRMNNIEYYYQTGVNIFEHKKISPGMVILGKSINDAINNGIDKYDMMQAAENSYKLDYGCDTEILIERHYFSRKFKPRVIYWFLKLIKKPTWLNEKLKIIN